MQAGCQRFKSAILHEFFITPMSLISQRDRQLAIEALEYYRDDALRRDQAFKDLGVSDVQLNDAFMMELNALINWIKLEYEKKK